MVDLPNRRSGRYVRPSLRFLFDPRSPIRSAPLGHWGTRQYRSRPLCYIIDKLTNYTQNCEYSEIACQSCCLVSTRICKFIHYSQNFVGPMIVPPQSPFSQRAARQKLRAASERRQRVSVQAYPGHERATAPRPAPLRRRLAGGRHGICPLYDGMRAILNATIGRYAYRM